MHERALCTSGSSRAVQLGVKFTYSPRLVVQESVQIKGRLSL
jgi:hypothetical protein